MAYISRLARSRAGAIVLIVIALLVSAPQTFAAPKFTGRWIFTITVPDAPGSDTMRIFTVNINAAPRDNSLHGRLTIADETGLTIGGVWRQDGKRVSVTYELPCPDPSGRPCATLILSGKIKGEGAVIKKGDVIVMWDTENSRNPALYDTSNGTFNGQRVE